MYALKPLVGQGMATNIKLMESKPQIAITIELKEREFISRVLLARALAVSGWRVYLGSETAVSGMMRSAGPTILLHKATHPKTDAFRQRGHKVISLDEEGGITTPRSMVREFCRLRYGHFPDNLPDMMLVTSPRFKTELEELAEKFPLEIRVTGWPRIDTWFHYVPGFFKEEAFNLVERYGKYYLFPSSFGAGSEKTFKRFIKDSPSEDIRVVREQRFDYFKKYVDLITYLDPRLRPGEKIIVRPHTSETLKDWKKTLKGLKNTLVIREGDITPWLIATKSVLTFGSTVAVQASLFGKRVIQFDVDSFETVTDSPSFELSLNAKDKAEVLELLTEENDSETMESALSTLEIDGSIDKMESATSKVVRALEEVKLAPQEIKKLSYLLHFYLGLRYVGSFTKHLLLELKILRGSFRKSNNRSTFGNLPGGLSLKEVQNRLSGFEKELPVEGRISVKRESIHLFRIEKSSLQFRKDV